MNLHQEDILTALHNVRNECIGIIHFQTYTKYPDEVATFWNRVPVLTNLCQLLHQNQISKENFISIPDTTIHLPTSQKATFAGGDIIINGGGVKSGNHCQEWLMMELVYQ